MHDETRGYLEFLDQVEAALAEVLDGGLVDKGAPQYAEFAAMRRDVAAVRSALAASETSSLREAALGQ